MKTILKVASGAMVVAALASCSFGAPTVEVIEAAKGLKSVIAGIQAGQTLVKPDEPTSRALTPSTLETSGVPNPWTYVAPNDTPSYVYGVGTGTKRFPASGYYEMNSGDQLFFTLTPESSLGGDPYYRLVLYTYPAFDMTVAYTIEEYIVKSDATTPSWPWENRNLANERNKWISLQTAYLDGTTGTRTVVWNSNQTSDPNNYYAAFSVPEPDPPDVPASFIGYRYEESATPPPKVAGPMNYSSHTTENVKGKGATTDSIQYYTETSTTVHSGLTYVIRDKKSKWSEDTRIVTRMEEDTSTPTKTIRSVTEIGTTQYWIDKVDIWKDGSNKIVYTSTHDVYNTALPRGGNAKAKDWISIDVTEDGPSAGTFTGTLQETDGSNVITRDVRIDRDDHFRFQVTLKYKSTGARSLADEVHIPLTRQDLSNLSIPMPVIGGTFNGFYEAGNLFGTITTAGGSWDVVVAEEGVAINDVLYPW